MMVVGATVPCINYSYSQSLCILNPACMVNPTTLNCESCTSVCGPDTTPCAQAGSSQCSSLSGRCQWLANGTFVFLIKHLVYFHNFFTVSCADLPCASVTAMANCAILPECQWSIAASYCFGISMPSAEFRPFFPHSPLQVRQ